MSMPNEIRLDVSARLEMWFDADRLLDESDDVRDVAIVGDRTLLKEKILDAVYSAIAGISGAQIEVDLQFEDLQKVDLVIDDLIEKFKPEEVEA